MKRRDIEIDLEIHKLIEFSRQDFQETECDILRRIFLDKQKKTEMEPLTTPRVEKNAAAS